MRDQVRRNIFEHRGGIPSSAPITRSLIFAKVLTLVGGGEKNRGKFWKPSGAIKRQWIWERWIRRSNNRTIYSLVASTCSILHIVPPREISVSIDAAHWNSIYGRRKHGEPERAAATRSKVSLASFPSRNEKSRIVPTLLSWKKFPVVAFTPVFTECFERIWYAGEFIPLAGSRTTRCIFT